MKSKLWAGLVLALVTAAVPAAASPVPRRCTLPEPTLEYSRDAISITLTVDYSACRWWQGDAISLSGMLKREAIGSPVVEEVGAGKACLGDGVVYPDGRTRVWRPSSCSLEIEMSHEELEVATSYSGHFEFPWRRGSARVEFSYTCTSTPLGASCDY